MNETIPIILQYGYNEMELNKIEALVLVSNLKSISFLQKHGFLKEGLLRENTINKGSFQDEFHLGLLQSDWKRINI